jgi:UDP-GlcNAc3NAcA epimerase
MKVVSLIGARPQFIKASVVSEALAAQGIQEILVNSGQHYDANMSDVFFRSLQIPTPKYNLAVGSGNHGAMTAKIMTAFEEVVINEKPDAVVVYGDTNTTLAGAIVAAKLKVAIAHVEAGIRMLPRDMPEEINRVLVDRISRFLFCPTQKAIDNLKAEGLTAGVSFTGDVMYDVFLKMKPSFNTALVNTYGLQPGNFVLVTLHRDYNVDNPAILQTVLQQLNEVNGTYKIVFSVHPRTRKRIQENNLQHLLADLVVTEPLDYPDLMGLTLSCKSVITDSGGLQKESFFAGKQAVVVMPDTGWVELIEAGVNVLAEPRQIAEKLQTLNLSQMPENVYGNGKAGEKIATLLKHGLSA